MWQLWQLWHVQIWLIIPPHLSLAWESKRWKDIKFISILSLTFHSLVVIVTDEDVSPTRTPHLFPASEFYI